MKPYYADERVALYHGDALEIIATLDQPLAAIVTDPPFASGCAVPVPVRICVDEKDET